VRRRRAAPAAFGRAQHDVISVVYDASSTGTGFGYQLIDWLNQSAARGGRGKGCDMDRIGGARLAAAMVSCFLAACGGSDGARGEDGTDGTNGAQGAQGSAGAAGATGAAGANGAVGVAGPTKTARLTDKRIVGWSDANRAKLDKLLLDRGIASPTFDAAKRPVAVFDWDNTVVKNDIGDATFFWMVKHDKIRQPAGKDWGTTSTHLTAAAKTSLNTRCDGLAAAGEPLPTSTNAACADALVHIYANLKTPTADGAAAAWLPEVTSKTNTAYAWVAQLTTGWTPDDVRGFARAAFWENVSAPIDATQTVGTLGGLNAYLRIYEPIEDLIGAFKDNGFDVWVLTASPQYFVDAISEEVGIPKDRVVGIRTVLTSGVATSSLEGCGTVTDGSNTMITFDTGKRCWINKVVFRELSGTQMSTNTDVTKRPVFVAGDSDTDIAMLKDATDLKLVINRGKIQTMCNALANYQGKWIIEPMFINPRAKRLTPYDCDTAKDHDGVTIVNEVGQPIPKQSEP
jgi:hypothetical protein